MLSGPLERLPALAADPASRSPALLIVVEVAGLAPRRRGFGRHIAGAPETITA